MLSAPSSTNQASRARNRKSQRRPPTSGTAPSAPPRFTVETCLIAQQVGRDQERLRWTRWTRWTPPPALPHLLQSSCPPVPCGVAESPASRLSRGALAKARSAGTCNKMGETLKRSFLKSSGPSLVPEGHAASQPPSERKSSHGSSLSDCRIQGRGFGGGSSATRGRRPQPWRFPRRVGPPKKAGRRALRVSLQLATWDSQGVPLMLPRHRTAPPTGAAKPEPVKKPARLAPHFPCGSTYALLMVVAWQSFGLLISDRMIGVSDLMAGSFGPEFRNKPGAGRIRLAHS